MQVFDVASGALLATETIERGIDTVAFEPGTRRLAFGSDFEPRLRVAEVQTNPGEGPKLVTLQIFEAGFDPAWTSSGLFFGSPRGIERWDGKATGVVVGPAQAFPGSTPSPSWVTDTSYSPSLSPSGRFVAISWPEGGSTIYVTDAP